MLLYASIRVASCRSFAIVGIVNSMGILETISRSGSPMLQLMMASVQFRAFPGPRTTFWPESAFVASNFHLFLLDVGHPLKFEI